VSPVFVTFKCLSSDLYLISGYLIIYIYSCELQIGNDVCLNVNSWRCNSLQITGLLKAGSDLLFWGGEGLLEVASVAAFCGGWDVTKFE
jgi:hypothetical protein